jgi:hypothetical protein
MNILSLTPTERARKQLDAEHLTAAVHAVQQDGYVILQDCVDRAHAELLCEKMLLDTRTIWRDDVLLQLSATSSKTHHLFRLIYSKMFYSTPS